MKKTCAFYKKIHIGKIKLKCNVDKKFTEAVGLTKFQVGLLGYITPQSMEKNIKKPSNCLINI